MLHVRFEGHSYDLECAAIGVAGWMSDADILRKLASHFDISPERFDDYVVDRAATGALVVRPQAIYG